MPTKRGAPSNEKHEHAQSFCLPLFPAADPDQGGKGQAGDAQDISVCSQCLFFFSLGTSVPRPYFLSPGKKSHQQKFQARTKANSGCLVLNSDRQAVKMSPRRHSTRQATLDNPPENPILVGDKKVGSQRQLC